MNVIDRIMAKQFAEETSLGNPLHDSDAIERRLTHFAQMTGGRGFRVPAKTPRKDAQGLTRGDRRRLAYHRTFLA